MKVLKRAIIAIILIGISIGLLVVGNGYDMYKEAIEKVDLAQKIESIKQKENYTKIEEVTDYECILLAGIPNAPSVYASTKNPKLAKQRQKQVMAKMVQYGYLTEEEANRIEKGN